MSRRFVRWYMGRVAGRYCPCQWPLKSKLLIHLCGRIDDAYERQCLSDSADFVLGLTFPIRTTTTASGTSAISKVTYTRRRYR